VQIALIDRDDRPGCHIVCSGFRFEQGSEVEREFARHMKTLADKHKLGAVARSESRHFVAWGNAGRDFTAARLGNCERLYVDFFPHFEAKGFKVRRPAGRLMIAVFDSQSGFEAYLGQKMPSNLVGIYHPPSNRLVIYDIHKNRAVVEGKQKARAMGEKIPLDIDRVQYLGEVERRARMYCDDANVSTTAHEAAHQLSFNCGLLNPKGDVPSWLAEGLACYCESSSRGEWQGVGAPNFERTRALVVGLRGGPWKLVPLAKLVGNDDWRKDAATLLTGYAQSWALFRMLMEERPRALRAYLNLIHDRRAPEHRLTDFRQVFGADLSALERRHQEYLRDMVQRYGPRQ
jgi:hypothetical protein